MFNRRPARPNLSDEAAPPMPTSQPRRATSLTSIIGADLAIFGNVETRGAVQIDGEVQGDVSAGRIVVGEQGVITGALTADEIVIGGNVQGSIRGNTVTFRSAGRIEGDVFHKTLTIEQGAFFEGKSRRSNDPMSVPVHGGANGAGPHG